MSLEALLSAYLLQAMITWAPPSDHDWKEPRIATEAHYLSIADDMAHVAMDPLEPPLFEGGDGRARTALYLLAIVSFESGGFRLDVDREDRPTGDGGKAWCLAQLHDRFARGLTDRVSCFRHELAAVRESWRMCPYPSLADRLTGYTVGRCVSAETQARHRVERWTSYWSRHPFVREAETLASGVGRP